MTKKQKKLKTWCQFKQERFKNNPDEAFEYLKASLEQNTDMPEVIAEALKLLIECGFSLEIRLKKNKD